MLNHISDYTTAERRAITRALNIVREKSPSFAKQHEFKTAAATIEYCSLMLTDATKEKFACLFLDSQHRLIDSEILFTGTINSATVYPRELVSKVLYHNAAAIILCHNHPSGIPEPSEADKRLTRDIIDVMRKIDVAVLDHIIVGNANGCPSVSLAQRGLM